jgi:hypothetical protein
MMAVHVLPSRDADQTISLAYLIASGRSSALFAVLAGVGLALANGRTEVPRGTRLRAAIAGGITRAAIIGLIGLFLGELRSGVAVILVNYGFLFLVGAFFLGLGSRPLLWLGSLWVVIGPLLSHLIRMRLPAPTLDVPGFGMLFSPALLLREIFFTGYYPVFSWMAYLWIGMGLGRLPLRKWGFRLVTIGTLVALVAKAGSWFLLEEAGGRQFIDELPIQFFGVTPTASWWYLAVSVPHSATPFDLAHTMGTALLVIGCCLLAARFLGWLAAAGAMTLSLYTFHVAALATGAGRDDRPMLFLTHTVAALAFGVVWRRFLGRGPLETMTANAASAARDSVTP